MLGSGALDGRKSMGRPRSFDLEAVIGRAVTVFREHGYDGASLDHLKEATGLTAGSLYKAFKGKKEIFSSAFTHYVANRQHQLLERLASASTGRERVAELVRFYLESASGVDGRKGCLVLASLIEASTLDSSLRDRLAETMVENRAAIINLLRAGQRDGSIRDDLAVEPCADLLLCFLQGVRAVGKLRDPSDHDALVALALKTLD